MMNQTDATKIVEDFLEHFIMKEPAYRDGPEPKMWCQCAAKGEVDSAISIYFGIPDGESEDDPALLVLAQRAMDAMYAAHPELRAFQITHELST